MNSPDPLAAPEDGGAPSGYRLRNFELQAVVALHANGVVYRAWDHNLGIPVAIKEYLPQRLAWRKPDGDIEPLDADTIDSFERGRHAFVDEARLLHAHRAQADLQRSVAGRQQVAGLHPGAGSCTMPQDERRRGGRALRGRARRTHRCDDLAQDGGTPHGCRVGGRRAHP